MHLKYFVFSLFIILIVKTSNAQSKTDSLLFRSFIQEKMYLWGDIIQKYEAENTFSTEENQLQLINYYYGYIGYLLGADKEKEAQKYIENGEDILDDILENNPSNAAAFAYRSAFAGWRISLKHSLAPILGPRFLYCNSRGYELDSLNIQAVTDRAAFYFYAPEIFGGDNERAIYLYGRAISLMEEKGMNHQNWQYFNTKVLLAKANDKAGNSKKALAIYEEMLSVEPNFSMVKNGLLPKLKAKLKD